jgi:CO dehydrogenase/acetyl-CoA synthase beta subunit
MKVFVRGLQTRISILCIFTQIRLGRRYLDRKTKEHFKRLTRYDEGPKHVTEIGPKIPEFEDSLNPRRIIYLKDVGREGEQDPSDILNEKIHELCNAAEETSQFIKHVNTHLDKQKLRVDELKKLQKIFENQILSLDSDLKDKSS